MVLIKWAPSNKIYFFGAPEKMIFGPRKNTLCAAEKSLLGPTSNATGTRKIWAADEYLLGP